MSNQFQIALYEIEKCLDHWEEEVSGKEEQAKKKIIEIAQIITKREELEWIRRGEMQ